MNKSIRTNINKILKKNILIIVLMISMCPILGLSYARFVINTGSYRSNEMYIAELLYSVKLDNENKYEIEVPVGESEHIIEITSLNAVASNYKLAYKNNSNIKVEYASDYIDPSYGGILTTRTIMIRITNTSSSKQTLSLSVFGGYSFNDTKEIKVLEGYTEITKEYWKYDYETTALYVNNKRVDSLDSKINYKLSSYTCSNNETLTFNNEDKGIYIKPITKPTKCSLYFTKFANITNIIKNGSFTSSNVDGWSCSPSSVTNSVGGTITSKGLYINDTNTTLGYWSYYEHDFIENHVYYAAGEFEILNNKLSFVIRKTDARSHAGIFPNKNGLSSLYFTATNELVSLQVGSSTTNIFEGYAKNIRIIDLTKDFGEGNEPTQEWCDKNITYFEGTKTINY